MYARYVVVWTVHRIVEKQSRRYARNNIVNCGNYLCLSHEYAYAGRLIPDICRGVQHVTF